CVSVIPREALIGLVEALREEREEHHHPEADIEAPERRPEQTLAPARRIRKATHAEQRQPNSEHAIDAEQRGVCMRCGRVEPLHVIKREWRINEKAKQSRTNHIPDEDTGKECERPFVDALP